MPLSEPQDSDVVTYTIVGGPSEDSPRPYAQFVMEISQQSDPPSHDGMDFAVQELLDALSSIGHWHLTAMKHADRSWTITPTV